MDCTRLSDNLNIFRYSGICFDIDKAQLLRSSLLILHQENHFLRTFYWGRLNGVRNDYHIAYGYEQDVLNGQIYFYSVDGIQWLSMPRTKKCAAFLAPLAVTPFAGDPAIVTNVYKTNPPFPPNEDSAKFFNGPTSEELKDEDRLAAIVDLINKDAMIIPRGGWFKSQAGVIVENVAFDGLTAAEAAQEKSYLHARPPQQERGKNVLARPDYNYATDFLDTIDMDVPTSGCWNIQLHEGGHVIILQSSYWPGMTFYHEVNTPHYGALYVGHGRKNIDLPFMIKP